MARVLEACHRSPTVTEQMARVQNLLDPPTALLRPEQVLHVLGATGREPRTAEPPVRAGSDR